MSKMRTGMVGPSRLLAVATAVLGMTRVAAAAERYVATDGSDTAAGTASAPWATFAHAFSALAGGDTLIIKDGTYHQALVDMPSGTSSKYTIIKAEHDFKVIIAGSSAADASLSVNANYVQIEGMKFDGEGAHNTASIAGSHHVKLLRSAFYGAPCTNNTTVISAGPASHDLLFEDCWAFGCGRYKFTVYQSQRVIFRRCVSRHDYHKYSDDQCATFTTYDSQDTLFQNVIALDSGQDPAQYGNDYGGIWFENNDRVDDNIVVQGSIFLNLDTMAFNDPKIYAAQKFQDVVVWDSQSGGYFWNVYDDWQGSRTPSVSISHATMGKIRGVRQDATPAGGIGFTGEPGYTDFPLQVRDSLLYQCNSYGLGTDVTSDYNDFFGNAQDYMPGGKGAGAHDTRVDPKLKYILQIEEGTPLKKAASDGGDIGATVLMRYGVSGSLWGEPGYDQLTSESLWPYPNEAQIKADMAAWTGPHDGTRGFCAPGNGLYGGPITLSSYIWEYLGNACPSDKCTNIAGTGGSTSTNPGGTGGASGTGGARNSGGTTSPSGSGGGNGTGGARNSGGTTSTRAPSSSASGGSAGLGGARNSGGATSLTSSIGSTGGASNGSTRSSGGAPNTSLSSGTENTAGAIAVGGSGSQVVDRTLGGTAGAATEISVGGRSGALVSAQAEPSKNSDSGCGCSVPGKQRSRGPEQLLVGAALLLLVSRRARATPRASFNP